MYTYIVFQCINIAQLRATLAKGESVCTRCNHFKMVHRNICNRYLCLNMLFRLILKPYYNCSTY